jgi:hypothetical protein
VLRNLPVYLMRNKKNIINRSNLTTNNKIFKKL